MDNLELKEGQEVEVSIPFVYSIGEIGPVTGKILLTTDDCMDEVVAELNTGLIDWNDMLMTSKLIDRDG